MEIYKKLYWIVFLAVFTALGVTFRESWSNTMEPVKGVFYAMRNRDEIRKTVSSFSILEPAGRKQVENRNAELSAIVDHARSLVHGESGLETTVGYEQVFEHLKRGIVSIDVYTELLKKLNLEVPFSNNPDYQRMTRTRQLYVDFLPIERRMMEQAFDSMRILYRDKTDLAEIATLNVSYDVYQVKYDEFIKESLRIHNLFKSIDDEPDSYFIKTSLKQLGQTFLTNIWMFFLVIALVCVVLFRPSAVAAKLEVS